MSNIVYNLEEDTYYFECPHCNVLCQVKRSDIKCTIFRHAVYKKDLRFVNPHASLKECESWITNDEIYGCTKPFRFNGQKVEICDYI